MRNILWMNLLLMLSSCGIGGYWMNGNPSAGKNIKPYLHYWVKEGVSAEGRLGDGAACGGGYREANMPSFEKAKIIAERLPDEVDENKAYSRLFNNWKNCMKNKGYRYVP